MKNLKLALFFLPLMILLLDSCDEAQPGVPAGGAVVTTPPATTPPTSTPPTTTPPTTTTDFINFKLDGADIKLTGSKQVVGSYYLASKTVQIAAAISSSEAISLSIVKLDGNKAYPVTGDVALLSYIPNISDPYSEFDATEGSLTVTSFTGNILTGTFEFKAENNAKSKKTISGGSFSVKLINI